jgi:hypothetical protein
MAGLSACSITDGANGVRSPDEINCGMTRGGPFLSVRRHSCCPECGKRAPVAATVNALYVESAGADAPGGVEGVTGMIETPFSVPAPLEPTLASVLEYWQALKRGNASIPFWDDVKPSEVPCAPERLMLLDVFDKPLRFRLSDTVGQDIERRYGEEVRGLFIDEIEARTPFEYLSAQGSAAAETGAPTYYRHGGQGQPYSRLLLPLWGDGKIGMMLVAFTWA